MPAAITSTGAWTTITGLDTVKSNAFGNKPSAIGLNFEGLKTQEGVQLDEIRQFIQLAATNYGLNFWAAAVLIHHLLKAFIQCGELFLGDSTSPSRVFAP